MKKAKKADPVQTWIRNIRKTVKRKTFRWKAKLVLTAVLPGVITFLATAAARIFLRMTLRKAAGSVNANTASADGEPVVPETASADGEPVVLETARPEFVTPEPAGAEPCSIPISGND